MRLSQIAGASAWRPLQQRLFRRLWIASVASNVGTWMHEASAAWLMTSLTSSPTMIALMQTATTLPIFVLALPAGALADGVDRRRMLLATQALMFLTAAALGIVALTGVITPWLLLGLTFALGMAAAVNSPAWQATTVELVPGKDLPAAVTLTGMGLNLARTVGPALGGVMVALAGAWAVFFLNALSFLSVIAVLCDWRRGGSERRPAPQSVWNSVRTGVRYALGAPALRSVLIRTLLFVPFASALWALLPVVARHELDLNSFRYGLLFGCLGGGAVMGALVLSALQRKFTRNALAAGATVWFSLAMVALAQVRQFGWLCVVLVGGGAGWITLMASFNIATQSAAPSWVRARALAVYLFTFQGAMAVGSAVWGALAEGGGISTALLCAAAGLVIGLAGVKRYPLNEATRHRPVPSARWSEPAAAGKSHEPIRRPTAFCEPRHFAGATQTMRPGRLGDPLERGSYRSRPDHCSHADA
jgi:MFS family permease